MFFLLTSEEEMSDEPSGSDYSKGVIYWIGSFVDPRIYIGSTVDFDHRYDCHQSCFQNSAYTYKFYEEARKVGWESYWMMIVEEWPCSSERELVRREFDWIEATPEKLLLNTDVVFGKFSEAHKQKLRESWTEERRAAQSKRSTGCPKSESTREKLVEAWTEERRITVSQAMTGQKLSAETKQRISDAWTDERRAAQSKRSTGSNNASFRGGSILDVPKQNHWRVRWRTSDGDDSEVFGYGPRGKYTKEEAEVAARKFHAALLFD